MEDLGYKHQGYTVGYSQISQIRWLSVLDLKDKTEDDLLKEMDYQTRRNIKKTYEMDVRVRTLAIEETSRFLNYLKWLKKNMDLSLEISNILKKCKIFIMIIAC